MVSISKIEIDCERAGSENSAKSKSETKFFIVYSYKSKLVLFKLIKFELFTKDLLQKKAPQLLVAGLEI